MSSELDPKVFLLPLNDAEIASLLAVITLVLTSFDTMHYDNPAHQHIVMAHKPILESVKNKLKQRR